MSVCCSSYAYADVPSAAPTYYLTLEDCSSHANTSQKCENIPTSDNGTKWVVRDNSVPQPIPTMNATSTVSPEHKICSRDSDCQVIDTACGCPCGRNVDAVNRAHANDYSSLGRCTEAQMRLCQTALCSPPAKEPIVTCRNKLCVVEWHPIAH